MIVIDVQFARGDFSLRAAIRAKGRILALVGPSGTGKTTLLNLVAGLERPSKGLIAIGDLVFFDSQRRVDLKPYRRRLGYVFQEPRLFPHLTVAGNLRYGMKDAALGQPLVAFDDLVARLGLGALLARAPQGLSGGEKQRVAIGRALLSDPLALLLDEPLAGIDDARGENIFAIVETLRDAFKIPMIFVSHRRDEVSRLASEVALVERGRLIEAAPAA